MFVVTGLKIIISIHAPRVGCDKFVEFVDKFALAISIHAPRVGCDVRMARKS